MGERSQAVQVLLVEDDAELRQLLSECLIECGLTVATAGDGREALAYLRTHLAPRTILLDLIMKGMGGVEFLERMASLDAAPAIDVVVLTAAPAVDHQHLAQLGVSKVLQKPVSLLLLLDALHETPTATG